MFIFNNFFLDDLVVRKWMAAPMFLCYFYTENEKADAFKNNEVFLTKLKLGKIIRLKDYAALFS